jgi:hypothetical protein
MMRDPRFVVPVCLVFAGLPLCAAALRQSVGAPSTHVECASLGQASLENVRITPGVLHCAGGAGPDFVEWFTPIVDWVERGRAPERVIAQKRGPDGLVLNARPLCPFPQRAVHDGKGSVTDAGSSACRAR